MAVHSHQALCCVLQVGAFCDIEPHMANAMQGMGARQRRDNLRRTWVPTGKDLRRLEEERGIVIRFVIGYRWVRHAQHQTTLYADSSLLCECLAVDCAGTGCEGQLGSRG